MNGGSGEVVIAIVSKETAPGVHSANARPAASRRPGLRGIERLFWKCELIVRASELRSIKCGSGSVLANRTSQSTRAAALTARFRRKEWSSTSDSGPRTSSSLRSPSRSRRSPSSLSSRIDSRRIGNRRIRTCSPKRLSRRAEVVRYFPCRRRKTSTS